MLIMQSRTLPITIYSLFVFCFLGIGCSNEQTNTANPTNEELTIPSTGDPNLDRLNQKIATSPQDASLYAQRGATYYQRGGFDEAIADFSQAILLDSMEVIYFHGLADVYLDYNKSRLALNALHNATGRFPQSIPTFLKLSEFQLILKMNEESLGTINKIMTIDPQNAEGFFMMGMNFKDMGDDARAINSFQSAVENNPELVDAWIELGLLFDKLENPIATRYFDNALRMDSINIYALEAKGNHLGGQGKFKEAITLFKKIVQLDPQYANAYYNTGLAYLQLDSVEQAYRNFNISVNQDPTSVLGYYYRGYTQELVGNKEAATQDYQQALQLNPNFERAKQALEAVR